MTIWKFVGIYMAPYLGNRQDFSPMPYGMPYILGNFIAMDIFLFCKSLDIGIAGITF